MATNRPGGSYEHLLLYADGSIQPERAGAGTVALDKWGSVVYIANRSLPPMTNNEAEYAGLVLALEAAIALGGQFVEVRLDSEVVVYQMIGRFAVNSAALKRCHQQACVLARSLAKVRYTHIPREHNVVADALATEASAGRKWRMGGRSDVLDRKL
ncbi:ribonuclease HI family protein [Anaerolineae bacterium CFX9]|jgi:ribonuclease HI|nr:ribonuclease HI family protein [Anaerolineae bacterium CFX9]